MINENAEEVLAVEAHDVLRKECRMLGLTPAINDVPYKDLPTQFKAVPRALARWFLCRQNREGVDPHQEGGV